MKFFGFFKKAKEEKKEDFLVSLARLLYLKKELERGLEEGLVLPGKIEEAKSTLLSIDYLLLQVEELAKKDFFTNFNLEAAKNMAKIAPPGQRKLVLLILRGK